MISQKQKSVFGKFPECTIKSPVLKLTRASIQSKISKHNNLPLQTIESPLDIILREKASCRHLNTAQNHTNEKQTQPIILRPDLKLSKQPLSPTQVHPTLREKSAKKIVKLPIKDLNKLLNNLRPGATTSIGNYGKSETKEEKKPEEAIPEKQQSKNYEHPSLHQSKIAQTETNKALKHLDLLLSSHFNSHNIKRFKHSRKVSIKLQNFANVCEDKGMKEMYAVTQGITGKKYSPTAGCLQNNKVVESDTLKKDNEEGNMIFSLSFRKKLEENTESEDSMLEEQLVLSKDQTLQTQEESILDRIQLVGKIRELSPIKTAFGKK